MSANDELPEELAVLERALARRGRPVPSPELRRLVRAALDGERRRVRRIWQAATAASLLIAFYLRPATLGDAGPPVKWQVDAAEPAGSPVAIPGLEWAELRRATLVIARARIPRIAPVPSDSDTGGTPWTDL